MKSIEVFGEVKCVNPMIKQLLMFTINDARECLNKERIELEEQMAIPAPEKTEPDNVIEAYLNMVTSNEGRRRHIYSRNTSLYKLIETIAKLPDCSKQQMAIASDREEKKEAMLLKSGETIRKEGAWGV